MKLYDPISKDSVINEVFRICGATANTYALRDIIARVNSALDKYFSLAFEADRRWNFDDVNKTSPPIDTQDIVSGTNRYKIGTFTEKIINLIRLEVLDSNGKGVYLTPEILDNLNVVQPGNASGRINGVAADTFQELYLNASSGTPAYYLKYGDFIYLRPKPNYPYTAGLKAYFNRPASKFDFNTFTVTIATPGVLTLTAHGFVAGDTVMLETDGALPTGLSVDTVYYVVATVAANTFSLAATKGGTAINTTGSQSGIHYLVQTSKVPGILEIHHPYLARHASLPYLIEKEKPQVRAVASQIIIDEEAITKHFANRDKDTIKRLIPKIENTR